jgi:hypothetical protein
MVPMANRVTHSPIDHHPGPSIASAQFGNQIPHKGCFQRSGPVNDQHPAVSRRGHQLLHKHVVIAAFHGPTGSVKSGDAAIAAKLQRATLQLILKVVHQIRRFHIFTSHPNGIGTLRFKNKSICHNKTLHTGKG